MVTAHALTFPSGSVTTTEISPSLSTSNEEQLPKHHPTPPSTQAITLDGKSAGLAISICEAILMANSLGGMSQ
jgi:hypothetical protein